MTLFIDDEIERIFKRMSNSFFSVNDGFEGLRAGTAPLYYGYTMTVGPDGKPVVKEYGDVGKQLSADVREPLVDVIVDKKERLLKLVAEMPGVEKTDVKITVNNGLVDISAGRDSKKYVAKVPVRQKVDENSAKASYKNGILELTFKLAQDPKPKGKSVEVL
ncbi:MAG: Hsp20/alpha crystallin family protein [Thaumarchaeota archaeon]|nr:Hsp20/alpha crystallin family protein [Nitrososphaerota archaeon]